jgi:hypothetical protein
METTDGRAPSGGPGAVEALAGDSNRWRFAPRRMGLALAAMLVVGLAVAAGASACTRPPDSVWRGSFQGPNQTGSDEAFTTLAQEETSPGSEEIEFNGHATVTSTFEGKATNLAGTYHGFGKCSGAIDFSAEYSGAVGGVPVSNIKTSYHGVISGTSGSGTYETVNTGEKGTWTTSLYAIAQSQGARPGEVELVNPSSTTATSLSAEAVGGLPGGVIAPVGLVSYEVEGVAPGSTIEVTFKLPAGSHPSAAYKLLGGLYIEYPASKTKIGTETMTLEIEDNGPWDENPAAGAIRDPVVPVASQPEFGRCVKVASEKEAGKTVYHGLYTTATCTARSASATGKYEWHPGVLANHFKTQIKAPAPVRLETLGKAKVTCTGEASSGEITETHTVGGVKVAFTGCTSTSGACTTAGHTEGELESAELEGVLGIESVTFKSGKETRHAGLDLYPGGHSGAFLEYTCTGGPPVVLSGGAISAMPIDKMFTTGTVKYAESSGHQKPERFEGGVKEVLTSNLSPQVGLSLSATETTEEPIEINAYY